MGKKRQHFHTIQQPKPPKEPNTEKEIIERIIELEYNRISLRHYPSIRKVVYEDNVTKEIKRLQAKLEEIQKPKKANTSMKEDKP